MGVVEFVEVFAGFAEEVADDAAGYVFDVDDAFLEVGVVDGGEGAAIFFGDLVENEFAVVKVALEAAEGFVDEGAVFDDEEVGVEDGGVGGPDGAGDFLLNTEEFLTGGDEGGLAAGDFAGDVLRGDVAEGDFFFVLPADGDFTFGYAGGYAEALPDCLLSLGSCHR